MTPFLASTSYYLDSLLIIFYKVTGYRLIDYFIGTLSLAFICVLIGEVCVSLAIRFNKPYLDTMSQEISQKEQLSYAAYSNGDKESYRALNKEATDAWGQHFFTMAAYSAGIFWPIPFALAWMQSRFNGIEFPLAYPLTLLFGPSVGYTFTFIPLYILARICFKYISPHLPYFKGVQQILNE